MSTRPNEKTILAPRLDAATTHVKGVADAANLRVAIVVAQFNGDITSALLAGAVQTLAAGNLDPAKLTIVEVPGAWELPLAAQKLAQSKRYDAILALGAVIRGDTPHFDYVCNEASRGLMDVALRQECVVTFGVLTTDNLQQALDRIGGKHGHKGSETALAAIETANLFKTKL